MAFPGPLADTGENGSPRIGLNGRSDQFHNQDGLADTCASEHCRLAPTRERGEKVDDLYAGMEDAAIRPLGPHQR